MYFIALISAILVVSCKPNTTPSQETEIVETHEPSREELISGDVEKKWVLVPDADSETKAKPDTDVRFIFYRNYNLTTFGGYGSRQGHWSLDDDEILSFHFEGPDSLRRFELLQLDSNALRFRNNAEDELAYTPE